MVRLTSGGEWSLEHALAERVLGWRPQIRLYARGHPSRTIAWREATTVLTVRDEARGGANAPSSVVWVPPATAQNGGSRRANTLVIGPWHGNVMAKS